MATAAHAASPSWFRIVALIAILWNAFGVFMYLSSVGLFGDPLAGLSDAERTIASSIPNWITAAFAIGTFAGLAGSVGLFLGRRWAWPMLLLSLVALLILEGWIVFVSGAVELHGIAVPVTVTVGALLLAWLAYHARQRGWLR
ncbi:MAG: hypothetical protein ACXW27_07700 [Allosphingosinicella sp.]